MAECVHEISALAQLAYIASVRETDAFGYGYDDSRLLGKQVLHLIPECLDIKGQLRQIDQIRSRAVLAFGKGSGSGQSSCVSSHDLYDRDKSVLILKTETVADDLLH